MGERPPRRPIPAEGPDEPGRVRRNETMMNTEQPPPDGGLPDSLRRENEDEVRCRECGDLFGQITGSHLSFHGMTMEEYRESHPDAELVAQSVKDKATARGDDQCR